MPARAGEVNTNLGTLTLSLSKLEANFAGYDNAQFIPVDYTSNPTAFLEVLEQTAHLGRLKLILTETCHVNNQN